jgi:hypothetical protein
MSFPAFYIDKFDCPACGETWPRRRILAPNQGPGAGGYGAVHPPTGDLGVPDVKMTPEFLAFTCWASLCPACRPPWNPETAELLLRIHGGEVRRDFNPYRERAGREGDVMTFVMTRLPCRDQGSGMHHFPWGVLRSLLGELAPNPLDAQVWLALWWLVRAHEVPLPQESASARDMILREALALDPEHGRAQLVAMEMWSKMHLMPRGPGSVVEWPARWGRFLRLLQVHGYLHLVRTEDGEGPPFGSDED